MSESDGWDEVGLPLGPVPVAPCAGWSVGELLAWAVQAPFTTAWIGALQDITGADLSDADRLRWVQAWDRLRNGMDAAFLTAAGSIAEQHCQPEHSPACPGGSRCGHDWSRDELAAALHMAPPTASKTLMAARELAGRSVLLLRAVEDGRLRGYAAQRVALRLAVLDDVTAALVLERVMDKVASMTPGQLDRLAMVTIEGLRDPVEAAAARARARRTSTGIAAGVPQEDGMASATVTATAEEIAELLAWATRFSVANKAAGETRTVGQRRVDALLEALRDPAPAPAPAPAEPADRDSDRNTDAGAGARAAPDVPAGRRAPISLRLIMTADTLLGRDDDPAWLAGVGSIPAALARSLALSPDALQKALVDGTHHQLLALGREHRFPTAQLDRFVRARDETCTFPGCTRDAERADIDHCVPWSDGGTTDPANLEALCRGHHRLKHLGWNPQRHADGSTTWRSPAGLSYRTRPRRPPTPVRPCEAGSGSGSDWDALAPGNQPLPPATLEPLEPPF